ncbi:mCG21152, partial [Mus musculus]
LPQLPRQFWVEQRGCLSLFSKTWPSVVHLGKHRQTADKKGTASSTWYWGFLPTYSERKTTKNGVTRSLIPWTYPLAGCRMAQINRIRSKI